MPEVNWDVAVDSVRDEWCQNALGHFAGDQGPVCGLGAILRSLGVTDLEKARRTPAVWQAYQDANAFLTKVAVELFPERWKHFSADPEVQRDVTSGAYGAFPYFNDNMWTTHEDVVTVFEKARAQSTG